MKINAPIIWAEREKNMVETNTHQNEIQMIANAIINKNKRDFKRRKKELNKQAKYFSPFYRNFIYKVIKNGSLKIEHNWKDGYITPDEMFITDKLSKRQKNKIYCDINTPDILPHELGHAVDFWFGNYQSLTSHVLLSSGKTLKEIFAEEFSNKKEEIYKIVMNEYKTIINSNINDKAYDLLVDNMETYRQLLKMPVDLKDKVTTKKRRELQKKLYECGFVEAYYLLYDRKCFEILNKKYSPILDALSSEYDFDGLFLDSHEYDYYQLSKKRPVQEFFANSFEAKVTSKHVQFDNLKKLLPKSFEAFEELFFIFYDHITQNKRFTDVKLKERNYGI